MTILSALTCVLPICVKAEYTRQGGRRAQAFHIHAHAQKHTHAIEHRDMQKTLFAKLSMSTMKCLHTRTAFCLRIAMLHPVRLDG